MAACLEGICCMLETTLEYSEPMEFDYSVARPFERLRDCLFSGLILLILAAVAFFYIYSEYSDRYLGPRVSFVEGRCLEEFALPGLELFLKGEFQKKMEKAANDNFPYREPLLFLYSDLARKMNWTFLDVLGPERSPLLPVGSDIVTTREKDRLFYLPTVYSTGLTLAVANHARYYNDLANKFPNVNFSIFSVFYAGDICIPKLFSASVSQYIPGDKIADMMAPLLLSPNIHFDWTGRGEMQDPCSYFYRTDHHWNIKGAYQVYLNVYNLISMELPSVGLPFRPTKWYKLDDIEFRGSQARVSMYSDLFDELEDGEFNLPQYEVSFVGKPDAKRNEKENYKNKVHPNELFANHYGYYFGGNFELVQYVTDTPGDRNLLVLCDSFINSIEPLIACHYKRAYFIDTRTYGRPFNIEKFIKDNDISDVLFIGGSWWTLI